MNRHKKSEMKFSCRNSFVYILLVFIILLLWDRCLFTLQNLTFLAVFVALFGTRFVKWLDRPILNIEFDKNSDRCFRDATLDHDIVQEWGTFCTRRQYFRLKITNSGYGTARKVRAIVDIYYEGMKEAERFEPNCLRWITGKDNKNEIDIASGEVTYVNLLSQIKEYTPISAKPIKDNFFVIRWEICDFEDRGIAWDRESRKYLIKLIVHGDNIKAKTYWFQFIPDQDSIYGAGELLRLNK